MLRGILGVEMPDAWNVDEALEALVSGLRTGGIGIGVWVDRVERKSETDQELREGDWGGVVKGLKGYDKWNLIFRMGWDIRWDNFSN